jgi:hypothetical protein
MAPAFGYAAADPGKIITKMTTGTIAPVNQLFHTGIDRRFKRLMRLFVLTPPFPKGRDFDDPP